jgi:hypothetical protein
MSAPQVNEVLANSTEARIVAFEGQIAASRRASKKYRAIISSAGYLQKKAFRERRVQTAESWKKAGEAWKKTAQELKEAQKDKKTREWFYKRYFYRAPQRFVYRRFAKWDLRIGRWIEPAYQKPDLRLTDPQHELANTINDFSMRALRDPRYIDYVLTGANTLKEDPRYVSNAIAALCLVATAASDVNPRQAAVAQAITRQILTAIPDAKKRIDIILSGITKYRVDLGRIHCYEDYPETKMEAGDILVIKPGDKIPVYAEIMEDSVLIKEAGVESAPVERHKGQHVFRDEVNAGDKFTVRAATSRIDPQDSSIEILLAKSFRDAVDEFPTIEERIGVLTDGEGSYMLPRNISTYSRPDGFSFPLDTAIAEKLFENIDGFKSVNDRINVIEYHILQYLSRQRPADGDLSPREKAEARMAELRKALTEESDQGDLNDEQRIMKTYRGFLTLTLMGDEDQSKKLTKDLQNLLEDVRKLPENVRLASVFFILKTERKGTANREVYDKEFLPFKSGLIALAAEDLNLLHPGHYLDTALRLQRMQRKLERYTPIDQAVADRIESFVVQGETRITQLISKVRIHVPQL